LGKVKGASINGYRLEIVKWFNALGVDNE